MTDYCRICGSTEDKDPGERYCNGCLWALGEISRPPAADQEAAKSTVALSAMEGLRAMVVREESLRRSLGKLSQRSIKWVVGS